MSTTTTPERAAPAAEQSTARHWVVVVGTTLIMIAASVVLSGLSLVTAPVVASLYTAPDRVTPVNGGAASFLIYFTLMTSAIVIPLMFFSGQLLAKFGARVMLIVGAIVMALGLALFAISTTSMMFYAAGILIGLGYGTSLALIPPALVTAWFVAKKGLVLGIVLGGTGIGGFAWSFILPPLMKTAPDAWRTGVWLMTGVLLALVILPALFLIKNKPADVGLQPYGAATMPGPAAGKAAGELPGLTYKQALRSSAFWVAAIGFFVFGLVVAVTQVLSIVFKTAAYESPTNPANWTPAQVSFYSMMFMVWTIALVFWKPILGVLNDKIGLIGMMISSLALMSIALLYMPSMVYGSSSVLIFATMIGMSSGISNATVTPPLVMAAAVGPREFGRVFSLGVALYYAGNAVGAPLWGLLGNMGQYALGMRLAPILIAIFVVCSIVAVRIGKSTWAAPAPQSPAKSTS